MKNNKMVGTVKKSLVAMASVAATLAIVVGVVNYTHKDSNKEVSAKAVVEKNVEVKETVKSVKTETKTNLDNAKEAADFELVNEPNEKDGKWDGASYEYEYAKSDVDGDGKEDVVKLSYETSKEDEGQVTGKVVLSVNGEEKKTYELGAGQNPRNVEFIEMDGKYFVYFNIGELTTLTAQRVVSLQNFEEVLSDAKLPYMARVEKVMVDNIDKKLIFDYETQLNYIGTTEFMYEVNFADGTFSVDNKSINAVDGEFTLKKDAEFKDTESDDAKNVTVKKGEKLTLKSVRWNDALAAGNVEVDELNMYVDMYHFVTEDGKDVYLNPIKEGVNGYQTVGDEEFAIFEGIYFAQ